MSPTKNRRAPFAFQNLPTRPRVQRSLSAPIIARLGLRRYIIHSMGLIGVMVVVLLAFGVSFFVYQAEERGWTDRQNEAARNAARTVDLFLSVINNYMALASRLDANYLQTNPATFHTLLEQAPELQELIRLDARGEMIASAFRDEPVLSNLFTIPQSSWFQAARAGQRYYGEVQISASNQPYMLIALPAPDNGVVAARLKMTVLWNAVADIRFGEHGQAYIINRDGEIIAHQNPQLVVGRASISERPEYVSILRSAGFRWHGVYHNINNVEMVASSASIVDTGWIIITEVPVHEAFATSQQAFIVLSSAVLAAGIITILLTIRLLRITILEPVETLRAGAERIGSGDLTYRIDQIQQTEIGQVALAFNEMASRLSDREVALKLARDEALEASQFKSRLLANVGHDLRTPINAILGYAEIMSEGVYGSLNDLQRRANDRILSNARRLLNLINSMLDQAQIEAGKLVLRPTGYRPSELMTAVRETMEIPAQSRGLTLRCELSPDLPECVVGDQQRTQQIVVNLVENALKFTQKGSVAVCMARPDLEHWSITVSDTGAGIPPEARGFIFEPFRQVDGSPTREQKGVGLGLAIVRQLTLLMGGDIRLESEVGQGSIFTVTLPLVEPMDDRVEPEGIETAG